MLFVCICADSFISWETPFEEGNASNFDPSVVLILLDHQGWDLPLKSPAIIDNAQGWIKMNQIHTLAGWTICYRRYYFFYCCKLFLNAMPLQSKINLWL